MKYIISMTLLLIAAIIIVLLFLPQYSAEHGHDSVKIVRDTIIKLLPSKPVIIEKKKTKIIKLSDTVIRYHPFRSVVDTVIMRDTIHSFYEFPSGIFTLNIRRKPDTLRVSKVVVYRTKQEKEKWWEKPLMIMGGVLAGYTIGRVR